MPLLLVGVLGAVVGVGVYELFLRPAIAPAAGLDPASRAPVETTARSAGAMGSEALAQAAIAQAQGKR